MSKQGFVQAMYGIPNTHTIHTKTASPRTFKVLMPITSPARLISGPPLLPTDQKRDRIQLSSYPFKDGAEEMGAFEWHSRVH